MRIWQSGYHILYIYLPYLYKLYMLGHVMLHGSTVLVHCIICCTVVYFILYFLTYTFLISPELEMQVLYFLL